MNNDAHLMIVEDSPTQAIEIQYFLEQNGYRVTMAEDGEQAIAMLKDITPTIIISDIIMPRMNGYELCDRIKKNDKLKDIPVILLTSLSEPEDVINGLVCGANNFIVKPFDKEFLLSRIRYILINKEMRKGATSRMGIEIFFRNKRYFLSSERVQMIDLLLSTYEAAIQKNRDFQRANLELEQVKDELERRVLERTAELLKSNVQLQKEIEERKHVEKALRYSENELAIKNKISHVFITSPDGKLFENVLEIVLKALKSRYGIYGYIDEHGSLVCPSMTRDVWEKCKMSDKDLIFPKSSWSGIWGKALREGKTLYSNEPLQVPQGHIKIARTLDVPIVHSGKAIGNLLVGNKETDYDKSDVKLIESIADHLAPLLNAKLQKSKQANERRILETQLQQAQKMESIGTLASGIAHDFNNILFPILGYTEMLLEDISEDSSFRNGLNKIYTGALRARDLVKQILTFSRQKSSGLFLMKAQPIIKEVLKLIRSIIPTTIEIQQNIETGCGLVKADPTQIHQIVMNLTVNAFHAMEDIGGKMTVSLKEVELSGHGVISPDMTPGKYACLTVADTGTGMDKETIEKIFDPFFTTKEKGKGTGMGLSVVHGIVNGMGGIIRVYSEPGKGSEFNVYFPIKEHFSKEQNFLTKKIIQEGIERILLVDDEDEIITMEKQMLEHLGYKVTSFNKSIEALEAFCTNPDKFDLVISDMSMPNMSGDKLSVELFKIRPDIPILMCTGFSEIMPEEKAVSIGIKGFLMKPITMEDLSFKIREVLDKK